MSATNTIELSATAQPQSLHTSQPSIHDLPAARRIASHEAITVSRKGTTAVIITTIGGATFMSSLLAGLVTIALPVMARDLDIPTSLELWPSTINSLTCGCTLILSGTIADVVGARIMYMIGAFSLAVTTIACAVSQTSAQLIVFRAFAGIAMSFCLPSSVSLLMTYFAAGRRRNSAFAIMGGSQPIGFSIGLTMGGALVGSVGWRAAFYISAGINFFLFVLALFGLPKLRRAIPLSWLRLRTEVDWIGALILSSSLAMLLYVFAAWTGSISNIKTPASIACLVLGTCLFLAFFVWAHIREKSGKVVLIPNSLWRNKAFTSICLNVFLIWGSFNATEVFLTFLFQDVQELSAISSSVRFLPEPVVGATVNILMGLYVHRMNVSWALVASFVLSAISPLLLAVMRQNTSYWEFQFPAVALVPISCDVLYTISQLIITAEFKENTQALAGGVFNTVAQIGKSVGMAVAGLIASTVSNNLHGSEITHQRQLFEGYQAAWWFTMASTLVCIFITVWGLRGIGKIGVKRE